MQNICECKYCLICVFLNLMVHVNFLTMHMNTKSIFYGKFFIHILLKITIRLRYLNTFYEIKFAETRNVICVYKI